MGDVHEGALAVAADVAAHAHSLTLEGEGIDAGSAKERERLSVEAYREGRVPIGPEIEEHLAGDARSRDDTPLNEREIAVMVQGLLGLQRSVEGIGPNSTMGRARLGLESVKLRRGRAIVGECVDAREAAAQQLALDPKPVLAQELSEHPPVAVLACPAEAQSDRHAEHEFRQRGLRRLRPRPGSEGAALWKLRRLNADQTHRSSVGEDEAVAVDHLGDDGAATLGQSRRQRRRERIAPGEPGNQQEEQDEESRSENRKRAHAPMLGGVLLSDNQGRCAVSRSRRRGPRRAVRGARSTGVASPAHGARAGARAPWRRRARGQAPRASHPPRAAAARE